MEGTVAAPVPPTAIPAQDSPTQPQRNSTTTTQASLERALAALPKTPPTNIPAQNNRAYTQAPSNQSPVSAQPFLMTQPSPSQNIRMAAQNSLQRAIAASPQTPPSLLSSPTDRSPFTRQAAISLQSKTILTPQGVWQNVAVSSSSQHTLPAVQNFIQLAFQTVQRSNPQPQLATALHRAFPPTLVVTPKSPQTSLPAPFQSLQNATTHLPMTQESPKPQSTNSSTKQNMTTALMNGQAPKTSDAGINMNQPTTSKSQTNQSPSSPTNSKRRTQAKSQPNETETVSKRPILVAKRRQSPKSEQKEAEKPADEKATQNKKAQGPKSPEKSTKSKGSPVKQNSSRVAQTFKEYQRDREQKENNAQSNASGSTINRPWWRPPPDGEEEEQIDPKKRVLVSCFPAYTQAQDLVRVLSKFGRCQIDSCRNRLAVVTFENETQAKTAVQSNEDIKIFGEYIEIKPYTNPKHVDELYKAYKKVLTVQKGQDITMPDKIDLTGDFYNQLANIQSAIRLTPEQALAVNNLYNDLELVLQQEWPGCVAIPFGSIPTGLGIKSSDADCYVELPARLRPRGAAGGAAAFVTRARRLLQLYPNVFTHLVAIPRANTPIVKFRHVPSGFHCDVSAKTPLGAQNSKLIKLLFEHDVRLQRVAVLIKYWAKVHDLSGTGRLTNYALTMMVIFYLQQGVLPFLPPVEKLQRDRDTRYIVDYWNAGFSARKLPVMASTTTIPDILGGFFEFYEKFNFDMDVVCPFLGRVVRKLAFDSPATLPAEFSRYVSNVRENLSSPLRHGTAFCVQDPFEQSHNVASSVGGKLASEIRAYIKFAADAYRDDRDKGCNNYLRTILRSKPDLRPEGLTATTVLRLIPRVRGEITDPDWRARLREIIVDVIFHQILRLALERVPEDDKGQERQRRTKVERERYSGAARRPVWRRRKQLRPAPAPEAAPELVARQAALTDEILGQGGPDTALNFELVLWYRDAPRSFEISFRMLEGDIDSFRQFVLFLHTTVLDWFRVLLRPYQAPPGVELQAPAQADAAESAQAQADCSKQIEKAPPLDPADVATSLEAVKLDSTDAPDSSETLPQ